MLSPPGTELVLLLDAGADVEEEYGGRPEIIIDAVVEWMSEIRINYWIQQMITISKLHISNFHQLSLFEL